MTGKPVHVTVLRPDGTPLGTMELRPTTSLWRARKETPRVHWGSGTRDLEPRGEGWALRLRKDERLPLALRRAS